MLKLRLVTTLMFVDGVLFRTKKFVPDYFYTINFVDLNLTDEVNLIDISRDRKPELFHPILERFATSPLPVMVGGGISSVEEARQMMHNFAVDAFIIGRAASERFIGQLANKIGSQSVIGAVDFGAEDTHRVVNRAVKLVKWGAGGVYLQSIERDGSLRGYDTDKIKELSLSVNVPITAGNGCGNWQQLVEGYNAGASCCALTSIFHHTATSLKAARQACIEAGLPMRTLETCQENVEHLESDFGQR